MKICSKCKAEKPVSEFVKDRRATDGLKHDCKQCKRDYHKENAEIISDSMRKYYKANLDSISQHKRGYYKANIDSFAMRGREYHKANPDNSTMRARNRRARLACAEGSHSVSDVLAIFNHQLGMCASCKNKLFKTGSKKYHVDHVMPLALGGSNWPANLQCLCPSCNLSKGAKHPAEWAKQQGKIL